VTALNEDEGATVEPPTTTTKKKSGVTANEYSKKVLGGRVEVGICRQPRPMSW